MLKQKARLCRAFCLRGHHAEDAGRTGGGQTSAADVRQATAGR
jgi:hypothetical protein